MTGVRYLGVGVDDALVIADPGRPPWNGQGLCRSRRRRPRPGPRPRRLTRSAPRQGDVMAQGQAPDGTVARRKAPPAGERRRRPPSRRPRSRSRPVPKALRGRLDRRPRQIWPWSAHPASAIASWLAPSVKKPVATIGPSSIIAGQNSARTWRSPEATGAIRA